MSQYMPLSQSVLERVLPRLGFTHRPEPTLASLRSLYAAWCERVPFDNVRKLIHLSSNESEAPLPGSDAEDFLDAWVRHGAGGTCWSGAGALVAVLQSLKFETDRCIATMMAAPSLPPNHGSVRVRVEGKAYLVDTAILCGEPLLLDDEKGDAEVDHPVWGIKARVRDGGLWHIQWRPLHQPQGFECRLDSFGAERDEYRQRYDVTRGWSPFNYQLTARRNRQNKVLGASFGNAVTLHADGSVEVMPIDDLERRRILIEEFGMSEEIVSRLPMDRATPPPPGSKSAAEAEGVQA